MYMRGLWWELLELAEHKYLRGWGLPEWWP